MAARANRGVEHARHRHRAQRSEHRLRDDGEGLRDVQLAGPIENPNDLGPAIKAALEVVKRGEPALVDVVTQPR